MINNLASASSSVISQFLSWNFCRGSCSMIVDRLI